MNNIKRIADRYGLKLSMRSVSGGCVYDGSTLGLFYQYWEDDCPCCPKISDYDRPLRFCPRFYPIDMHDLVHDCAHHVVALDWCKDLPEWGLTQGLLDKYNANGGYHELVSTAPWRIAEAQTSGLLDDEEQERQEAIANLIGYILMQKVGIKPPDSYWQSWAPAYQQERSWVLGELPQFGFTQQQGWDAIQYMERAKGM